MILYHLDRKNIFPSNATEQLLFPIETRNTILANKLFSIMFPHGISKTGERYLNPFEIQASTLEQSQQTNENFRIFTIEYVFEVVRQIQFPHLPSRFTSLFACPDIQSVKCWYKILKNNAMDTSNATVKVIETSGTTFATDACWRDETLSLNKLSVFNPFAYHIWATKYWNGCRTQNPLIEVLCELPVTVLDSIPLPEFLSRCNH